MRLNYAGFYLTRYRRTRLDDDGEDETRNDEDALVPPNWPIRFVHSIHLVV